jgi:hypothetical protein
LHSVCTSRAAPCRSPVFVAALLTAIAMLGMVSSRASALSLGLHRNGNPDEGGSSTGTETYTLDGLDNFNKLQSMTSDERPAGRTARPPSFPHLRRIPQDNTDAQQEGQFR